MPTLAAYDFPHFSRLASFILATLRKSALAIVKERSLAGEVGKRGARPCLLINLYVARLSRPAGVLARPLIPPRLNPRLVVAIWGPGLKAPAKPRTVTRPPRRRCSPLIPGAHQVSRESDQAKHKAVGRSGDGKRSENFPALTISKACTKFTKKLVDSIPRFEAVQSLLKKPHNMFGPVSPGRSRMPSSKVFRLTRSKP